MSLVLEDLVLYLENQGIGTRGVDLFYGLVPPNPDSVVVLFEFPGFSEPDMGKNRVRAEYPMIMAVVRGVRDDYDTPRAKIKQVVDAFAKIGDTLVNGVTYGEVSPQGTIQDAGSDDNFRRVFRCNFQTMRDYV